MTKNNSPFSILHSPLIRVAIVDDHKVVVDGIERYIIESGIAVLTGKAYSIAGCHAMLTASQPDVLLLDVGLPDGSGMDLCPLLKGKYPAMNILILTNYAEYTVISHVLNNGASGYILKNASPEEIMEGIEVVASGKRYLCEATESVLKKDRNQKITLTRQERELLKLLSAGYTSREIADRMNLGYETIRSYRRNLQTKLEVHNTAQLVKTATENRLL
jgi:DNA-binding NarL/FixJ family response regulator